MSSAHDAHARMMHPDARFSPAPIWWWSGDALDPQRLRWQLERFVAGHVYNVVILNLAPTGPLHGSLADAPHFLTPEWWSIFRGVCADARELGVRIWFYDQIGFSGANVQGQIVRQHPEYAGQMLASSVYEVATATQCTFPAGSIPLGAWQQVSDDWQPLVVSDHHVQSTHQAPHRVRLVYAVVRGFDYASVAACRALRQTVHEAFAREAGAYFGDVIVGSFQDELPSMPTWSADFGASFATHYGYALEPHLLALFEADVPNAAQVRIDYQRWRAHRCEVAFFRPFYDWHAQHGLICGFDQQSPARMALPIGAVDEYADYLQTHRWYGAPGSDHHGNGKIHSSLAHLYERPRAWIEAFHSSGWGGTLEETFDWLVPWLRTGLTLYNPHAVYYSTHGGWWEWAPPSTCWRQPYWRHYPQFADAVMRLTGVLSLGRHVCDIAVLFPTTTVQANLLISGALPAAQRAEQVFVEITGSMFWNNPKAGVLDHERRDFDMIDDDSLQRAIVADGGLEVAGERYRCIILPALTDLVPEVAQQLRHFAEQGGLLITVATCPAALADCGAVHQVASAADLPAVLTTLPQRISGDCFVLERRVTDGRLVLVTPTQSATTFAWNGHWNSTPYHFDATRLPVNIDLHIDAPFVEQWSVLQGTRTPLMPYADGHYTIALAEAPVALLFVPDVPPAHMLKPAPPVVPTICTTYDLAGTWQVQVEPVVENTWGDLALPASEYLWPQTFRLYDVGQQREVVVGFGVYGWYHGPVSASQQPDPLVALQPQHFRDCVTGWSPLVYSLSHGIPKDTLHWGMLGPKGYVPEEFMDFGRLEAGQSVRVRTTFTLHDAFVGALVLGAPTAKRLWIDGVAYADTSVGYQWLCDVALPAGFHLLEFELMAEQTGAVRGYWALTHDRDRFRRPIWIMHSDTPQANTPVEFAATFTLATESREGACMITTDAPLVIHLDGVEIGRQGGFDPYGSTVRVQPHPLPALSAGSHTLVLTALDGGRGVTLLVDGQCQLADATVVSILSGKDWQMRRGENPWQAARIRRRTWVDITFDTDPNLYVHMDPGWPLLERRPHPLPRTRWLSGSTDTSVVDVVPDAYAGTTSPNQLRWRIPVGATAMAVTVAGSAQLTIDGVEVPLLAGMATVPAGAQWAELVLANDESTRGVDATALAGPVTYHWGSGEATLPASFAELGLADFAGAVHCWREVVVDAVQSGRWVVRCEQVRGTMELRVNGQVAGVRIWSPYEFDVTDFLQSGVNRIELLLTNTLAGYLDVHSPTSYTPAYQHPAGLWGAFQLVQYTGE